MMIMILPSRTLRFVVVAVLFVASISKNHDGGGCIHCGSSCIFVVAAGAGATAAAAAFARPAVQKLLARLQGPVSGNEKDVDAVPPIDPQRLLRELDLVSSTDPVLAGVQRPQQIPNLASASVPLLLRAGSGAFSQNYEIKLVNRDDTKYTYAAFEDRQLEETGLYNPPQEPIVLYEFEACPFCRKVREAASILSLTVTFKPTPRGSLVYRPEIKNKYGSSATFPHLVDPNTGVSMFESNDIVRYLFKVYGSGDIPWTLRDSPWVPLSAGLGVSLARLGAGGSYKTSNPPPLPLTLWAYEGSPFCKLVRECLCSLEIVHTVVFAPRGSPNRQALWELTGGRFQVPYLEDPNTGVSMFESEAIVEYLTKQYAVQDSPVAYM